MNRIRWIGRLPLALLGATAISVAAAPAPAGAGVNAPEARMPGLVLRAHVGYVLVGAARRVDDAPAEAASPARNRLESVAPNPFQPSTSIRFTVAEPTRVTLQVFDVSGRLVRTLLRGAVAPGTSRAVVWDGRDDRGHAVSAGAYFCRLRGTGFVLTRKLIRLQ